MAERASVVAAADLPAAVQRLKEKGARLVTMVGTDERAMNGHFALRYIFVPPATGARPAEPPRAETLLVLLDPERPIFPSITPALPAAHWYEREVQDLLGLIPEGHPDPRPLVLHHWPKGYYPLRKDFVAPPAELLAEADGPGQGTLVTGEGTIAIPVGPIHAGIIEPGHFRFGAVGETVLHLEARLFYTHRGLEKVSEGKTVEEGLHIAGRICGACSVSHAVSYCQAVEAALGLGVPARAAYLRTLFLELERLYNHVGDIGNLCAGTGLAFGVSQGSRLKEKLQRLNAALVGHRFLRGAVAVGGMAVDLAPEQAQEIRKTLAAVEAEFGELAEILFSDASFMDRVATTGVLPAEAATDLGVVGVAARASGLDLDARRDWPHAAYGELPLQVVTEKGGDVLARLRVRAGEVAQSFGLIRACLENLPGGEVRRAVAGGGPGEYRTGLGTTESPRGENVHWVRLDPQGRIERLRVRSASFTNWPAVPLAVPGNIVPDFPLINKSFELCYACLDR